MSIRTELKDMRDLLGEAGYIEAIWAMRANAAPPVPKPHLRGWKYRRPGSNNVLTFTGGARDVRGPVQTKV